ncbi:transcriptional regulator [Streptomyces longispororuber]|uniref:Transcriptional regulator n=1 Tax=Streptomyces longispororuber TaxID=68230 RepID=A0A918ZZK3_9ACTN|nr:helix-turn-helix transcriptional regulator [Streptomyces longispororuber]GHE77158.1 transcriptional regulator [Streptomyces longispororuber]
MPTSQNPLFLRQRLRDRLRKAREAANLTQRQVAEDLDWSPSKLIRIENGKIGVSVTDVMALLTKYQVNEEDHEALLELARSARQLPWYWPYRSVASPEFQAYLAYEGSASIVRAFERNVMPGLLQTEAYMRALLGGFTQEGGMSGDREEMEARIQLRLERQQRVITPESGQFFFILDEAALRRVIGSEAVMRQQHEQLLAANDMPNVTVMYVPFSAGIYPFFRTPYAVFEFEGSDDDIVAYLETPDGEVLLSERTPSGGKKKQPADYLDAFWKVERSVAKELTEESLLL